MIKFKKINLILISLVIALNFSVNSALALSPADYSANGIYFLDNSAIDCSSTGASSLAGGDNIEKT